MRALVAVAVIAASGCTVRTRSDKLDGGAGIDVAVCPAPCETCDFARTTCVITGHGVPLTCPTGWNCNVSCNGAGSCPELTCGAGRCTQVCQGAGACGVTSCDSSCKCDVTCLPDSSACGTMTCPVHANKDCRNAMSCDSSVFPQCDMCP